MKFDYVIIGAGIAGLSAAYRLAPHGNVCVITKGGVRESSTRYAQGGIAVAMKEDDAPRYHFEDTIKAGAGLCNETAVKILVEEGPKRVQELIEMGAKFDQVDGALDFTTEAAHGRRRILHAADATGREIEKALGNAVLATGKVTFLDYTSVIKLLVEDNHCFGCVAMQHYKPITITAKAVMLATGGVGQIYLRNTNPPVSTGDGIALAFAAGCDVQDMEFIQFHPTTLYLGDKKPISLFLISEAVRGEGAILRNVHGERFVEELAPRDIVARAIFQEMQRTDASHVYLDLSGLKVDVRERFPTIYRRCLESKIDITRDFIPVAPAAHYFMGGVSTDLWGCTAVNGLYAAGEVTSLGLHGANRLASNSLLDGLVFGYRAAEHALGQPAKKIIDYKVEISVDAIDPQILAIKQEIRELMWRHVGIVRNETGLRQAFKHLMRFKWVMRLNSGHPALAEVQSMLLAAGLITQFALQRKESRGAHFRSDFPQTDDQKWKVHLVKSRKNIKAWNKTALELSK